MQICTDNAVLAAWIGWVQNVIGNIQILTFVPIYVAIIIVIPRMA